MIQWHTQAGNINNNSKSEVGFNLPTLIAMNSVTWNFHGDDPAKGGYDMILG